MPILPSAKKALRASRRKAQVNRQIRSQVKTVRDRVEAEPTQENLQTAYSTIDKAVKKNVFHQNKGARIKSQLAKLVAEGGSSETGSSTKKSKSGSKKPKKTVKPKKTAKPKKAAKPKASKKSKSKK